MTPFDSGYIAALRKLGAARWREEIRDGILTGTPEAQTLSRHFKWPEKAKAAIPKTLANIGVKELIPKFKDLVKGDEVKSLSMLATIPSGGAAFIPSERLITSNKGVATSTLATLAPKEVFNIARAGKLDELHTMLRFHETQEALKHHVTHPTKGFRTIKTPGGKGYRGISPEVGGLIDRAVAKLPSKIVESYKKVQGTGLIPDGTLGGMHMHPDVLLRERREVNLFSPEIKRLYEKIRQNTGEYGPNNVATTAKEMSQVANKRLATIAARRQAMKTAPPKKVLELLLKALTRRV